MSTENTTQTTLDKLACSPYPAWAISAMCAIAMPLSLRRLPGVPSFIQTPSFAAIFGGAGYVTSCGDYENGAGIATAWSITYLVLNVNKAIRSKRPIPILMLTAVAGNGFIYGQKYFREYFA